MTVASIDIGSNTVLLLIAKVKKDNNLLLPIQNYYRSPRIGAGIDYNRVISDEAIYRLMNVLEEYREIISKFSCNKTLVVGTYSLRNARNSHIISRKIRELFGWELKIVTGEEEAALSFLGAAFPFYANNLCRVIDIGGGSTELIFGDSKKIIYKNSFNVGVVTLTEKFQKEFLSLNPNLVLIENYVKEVFSYKLYQSNRNYHTIAIAGTPTTLSCIKQNLKVYSEEKVEGSKLTKHDLIKMIEILKMMSPEQVKKRFGNVVSGREDVLLSGTIILKCLMDLLNTEELTVSAKGLRYGAIIRYIMGVKLN